MPIYIYIYITVCVCTCARVRAFHVLLKAGNQGEVESLYMVGTMYYYGQGVSRDEEKARAFWTKSADGGDADAQYNLAMLYETWHVQKKKGV